MPAARTPETAGRLFLAALGSVASCVTRQRLDLTSYDYQPDLLIHDHTELLVYHWQPGDGFAGPDHPHLHVSAAVRAQDDAASQRSIDLDKRHLATGRVSLEAVVRMLIEEFAIAPLRHDWRQTLERVTATLAESPP